MPAVVRSGLAVALLLVLSLGLLVAIRGPGTGGPEAGPAPAVAPTAL